MKPVEGDMRISRVQISNFRNFRSLDISLAGNSVIVGENKIGKTNLLYALRLVLDPSLPDSARQLRSEDFWDGLHRPLTRNDRITIALDFTDFEGNENHVALLAEHLVVPTPMTARLTYVFQPLETLEGEPLKDSDYEFFLYGGDRPESHLGSVIRREMPLDLLPALRDAEGDIANWRRSPLRPLLDAVAARIDRQELETLAATITAATGTVAANRQVTELVAAINTRMGTMVGPGHTVDTILGFSPTDPDHLLRALRLYIDAGRRDIAAASLGSANILYLTLKALDLQQAAAQGERHHTFLAIEEPEAHLHPHLQRLVYRDLLRSPQGAAVDRPMTILLTTHSPHIVSVAPLNSIALLRKAANGRSTEGASSAALQLDSSVTADLERYLDVTRGEILFAKAVILVEGEAERFLIPALAKAAGVDLDECGVSVCSVAGTNFAPYLALLGRGALRVPTAVITDGDPGEDGTRGGDARAMALLPAVTTADELRGRAPQEQLGLARECGLFVGDHTLEVDLFRADAHVEVGQTLAELAPGNAARTRAAGWQRDPATLDPAQFLNDLNAIGKGRYAQRLSTRVAPGHCPRYIMDAIQYACARAR